MDRIIGISVSGFFILLIGFSSGFSQGIKLGKTISNASEKVTDAVTSPVKNSREAVGNVSQDARNVKNDVTRPVDDLRGEVDGLRNEVDQAKSDYQQLKDDVNCLRGKKKDEDGDQADSTDTASSGNSDSADSPTGDSASDAAPSDAVAPATGAVGQPRMRSGTYTGRKEAPATSPGANPEPGNALDEDRVVLLPPNAIQSRPSQDQPSYRSRYRSSSRSGSKDGGSGNGTTGARSAAPPSIADAASNPADVSREASRAEYEAERRRQSYLSSPAVKALQRSDFDMETLRDLFEAAIWTGPDSLHTAVSIDYMLKQYRNDLNEVKRIDPDFDLSYFEDRYRKWNQLYIINTRANDGE